MSSSDLQPLGVGRVALVLIASVVVVGVVSGCTSSGRGSEGARVAGSSVGMVATGNVMNQAVPGPAARANLVDQNGRRLTLGSLRGRIVVLAPFLTMCQETCPMTSANLHRAAKAAESAAGSPTGVVFVELTVDPERDTVRRLHAYEKLYGALPDWRLATGKPQQVLALWQALGVSTDKTKPEDTVRDWMTGRLTHRSYDVRHQDLVMIIDPAGRLRWITLGRPDARGTELPTSMQKFLNDEGHDHDAHPGAGGASYWSAHDVEQAVGYVRSLDGTS